MFGSGDTGIWVVEEGGEGIKLLNATMVDLEVDEEVDAECDSGHQSDESTGGLNILLELLLGEWSLGNGSSNIFG